MAVAVRLERVVTVFFLVDLSFVDKNLQSSFGERSCQQHVSRIRSEPQEPFYFLSCLLSFPPIQARLFASPQLRTASQRVAKILRNLPSIRVAELVHRSGVDVLCGVRSKSPVSKNNVGE